DSGSCVGTKGDPSEASAGWRSWRLCRRDSPDPVCVAEGGPIRNGDPWVAVSFAESISLSSTVLVDLRLPPTALGLGFVLLALRARRARESRCLPVPAQEVHERKMPQFAHFGVGRPASTGAEPFVSRPRGRS